MGKYMSLAKRIKELRQVSSYTQQDLSQASGLSRSYISRLEMGDIALPSRDKLRSLAGALNTSLDDLLQAAGFLDTPAGGQNLPDIRVYLRTRYLIDDPRILQAFETLLESVQLGLGGPGRNGSRRTGGGQTAATDEPAESSALEGGPRS